MKVIKSIFISWDFILSVIIVVFLYFFLPQYLQVGFVKEIYGITITVLAIIFSVFFAALSILITAGDNEFVRFLQAEGFYKKIIFTFKFTLILLFIGFFVSISLFIGILPYALSTNIYIYPNLNFLLFIFFVLYALFATANSSIDAIRYAEFRARFLEITTIKRENHK